MEDIKSGLHENGYVETLFNRRVYINGGDAANQNLRGFAERQAINAPIQGTAADIIKNAMIQIHRELSDYKKDVSMLMQVHDELVFDMHKSESEELKSLVKEKMEQAITLKAPLTVDIGEGINWLEAH